VYKLKMGAPFSTLTKTTTGHETAFLIAPRGFAL